MAESDSGKNTQRWADVAMRPHPDVAAQRVQDEVVLVNLTTNAIYTLNRTRARAWELLEEGRSPSEVESALAEEFGVSRDEVASELHGLLDELVAKDLLQPR
jgi:hypothetical protein